MNKVYILKMYMLIYKYKIGFCKISRPTLTTAIACSFVIHKDIIFLVNDILTVEHRQVLF